MNRATETLTDIFEKAEVEVKKDGGLEFLKSIPETSARYISILARNSSSQKAVVTVLITSLVKKIEDPSQDIRLHKTEFNQGYSGRSYDTANITPFLKRELPRIAMAESGWLTRSIEQPHPFDLDFPGKIRNLAVKDAFLGIIKDIENRGVNPEKVLEGLFVELINEVLLDQPTIEDSNHSEKEITIYKTIIALKKHFALKRSAILPVVAIYSMYQVITTELERYVDKNLLKLKSHTTSDERSKSIGDIEVKNQDGEYFEGVEIKHNRQITPQLIRDAYKKFKGEKVRRYYFLTTALPEIEETNLDEVMGAIEDIRKKHGCEVIINGVIPTIKYYLRLIDSSREFVENYSRNLQSFYGTTSHIERDHVESWDSLSKGILG